MATLREIRRRIIGVQNTQKITKAMKMVAAAKLRRAQEAVVATRPYANEIKKFIQRLSTGIDTNANPYFFVRSVNNIAIVVVSSDRGLCGAFNSNLVKFVVGHIQSNYRDLHKEGRIKLICIGKKCFDYFQRNNYKIISKHIGVFGALQFKHAKIIVEEITRGFFREDFDKVEVVYSEFKSIMQQRIIIEQMLPIVTREFDEQGVKKDYVDKERKLSTFADYIYEPSSEKILSSLIPKHLNFQIWRILLESNAAEQGARMTAMDNATINAAELIDDLQLLYNKARQASITKELLEVVSGAEALRIR